MSAVRRFIRSPIVAACFIVGFVFFAIIHLRAAGWLESLELAAYDWFMRLQTKVSEKEPRVVILGITEDDIHTYGWPLKDAILAKVLMNLTRYEPRAIGLDIFRDVPCPPGQEDLASILIRNPSIIGVMKFGEGGTPPPFALRDTDQVGFNDILVDPGGIVRRGLLFLDDGKTVSCSFALRLALLYLQAEGILPQPDTTSLQAIRLGQTTIKPFGASDGGYINADDRGYQYLIDFKGAQEPFRSFSLASFLSGEVDPAIIKDKVVLVGMKAQSVKDFFFIPHSRDFKSDQQMHGITLHAHMVSQLLRFGFSESSPITNLNERQEALWIFLWGALGGLVGLWVRSPLRFFLLALAGIAVLSFTAYVLFLSGWWIPSVPPMVAWLTCASLVTAYMSNREKRLRSLLMQLFSRHVSQEVANRIWQQRDQFSDGGRPRSQKLTATVLFSDLKGFTSVAEKMDPQDLIEWLNGYMETMAQAVIDHGGVVDDYAGDGLKANFGIPLARTSKAEIRQDAVNAVNCALAMEEKLAQLNRRLQERELPIVGIRVGIFTGSVIAGSVGSPQRLKYTTVGDTVNTASRLESLSAYTEQECSFRPCRILIGDTTQGYLDHRFQVQKVGEVCLKGKHKRTTVYWVLGRTT